MPRLSLWKPNRTNDYRYLDRVIHERYTVGGVDCYVHKYLGPQTGDPGNADATLPVYNQENPLFIEDLLLLENRDRAYDPDVFTIRMVYTQTDIDFNLSQFGLFLNNDTLYITCHYNDMIDTFGRKIMSGDVLELPNMKDYFPLNADIPLPLAKYYVVQDASYASEGFSQTWLPHTWRMKATPMINSQEFQQILDKPMMTEEIWDNGNFYPQGAVVNSGDTYYRAVSNVNPGADILDPTAWAKIEDPTTLGDLTSTRKNDLSLNDALLLQANLNVPASGFDTVKFYILPTYADGQPATMGFAGDDTYITGDVTEGGSGQSPTGDGYTIGYLTGDGIAPNGLPVTPGVQFPAEPVLGDYCLRLDYHPNRLFRYSEGGVWTKIEDNVRTSLSLGKDDQSQLSNFINNDAVVPVSEGGTIPSRQTLSQLLRPQADNG